MKREQLSKVKSGVGSKADKGLMIVTIILVAVGLVFVADASAPSAIATFGDKFYFFKQQLAWAILGIVGLFIIKNINYKVWSKYATFFFIISIVLLILVLIPGLGTKTYGARRWLMVGPVSIQPSELIKLTGALYLAKLAEKKKEYLAFILPIGLVCLLVMLQPDLGTTISFAFIAFAQLFVSGLSVFKMFITLLFAGVSGLVLTLFSDYRRDRLLTYFDSLSDPLGKSYHIRQILIALGSGGIFGVGLGQSRQKYLFLPESATDSIFAVLAEELGLFGSSVIIILFAYYVFRGLRIASHAPDIFSKILATGIVAWVGGQMLLNIGAMVAITPLTGVPLPFFSYGGSALTTALAGTGILLNISSYAQQKTNIRKIRKRG